MKPHKKHYNGVTSRNTRYQQVSYDCRG